MSFDVAYIVSHGFAARMVTQTNLLGKLVEKGKRVALIAPDENDPNLVQYCKKYGVSLFQFNEKGKLSNQRYIFKRKYFLEDLNNNPALKEKHIYTTRFNSSLNPFTHIWPRYYGLLYKLRKKFPAIGERFKKNEKKYLRSENARRLIHQLDPKKLVATYPVNFNEAVLLHYANKSKNTETWIHLLSWDNITSKGYFPELAQKYIAWGPVMKDEIKEYYGVTDQNIHMCGVPHFDVHIHAKQNPCYEKYLVELGLDPSIKYMLLAMSSPRFAPREIDIANWLADRIVLKEFERPVQLVIRVHPQNVQGHMADKSWLPRLRKIGELPGMAIDMPNMVSSNMDWSLNESDMERLSQLITGSVIVLNSGSTVSIDALIHNKPVVLTSFDGHDKVTYWRSARRLIDYKHLKKLKDSKGVEIASSYSELMDLINALLADPYKNIDLRTQALSSQITKNDGLATDRIVKLLNYNCLT